MHSIPRKKAMLLSAEKYCQINIAGIKRKNKPARISIVAVKIHKMDFFLLRLVVIVPVFRIAYIQLYSLTNYGSSG